MSETGGQGQTMARPEQPPQQSGLGHKPQCLVFMWSHYGEYLTLSSETCIHKNLKF